MLAPFSGEVGGKRYFKQTNKHNGLEDLKACLVWCVCVNTFYSTFPPKVHEPYSVDTSHDDTTHEGRAR